MSRCKRRLRGIQKLAWFAAVAVSVCIYPNMASADEVEVVGRATVIDADTISIRDQKIRLHGIDAPESRQSCEAKNGRMWRCGQKAALALSEKIGVRNVTCRSKKRGRYKRLIAKCTCGGADLGKWLVRTGKAFAFVRYSKDYVREEAIARARKLGVWAGRSVAPWEWRKGQRLTQTETTIPR